MHRRMAWLVGLIAVAVLSACSGGLPSDFAVYRGDGFSVGSPGGWKGCQGELTFNGGNPTVVQFSGPTGTSESFPPLVQVTNEGTTRTFDHALKFHRLQLQVRPGYRLIGEEDLDVPGAKKAVRIEYRHDFPIPSSPDQPRLHGITLLVETPDASVVSLLALASDSSFDDLKDTFEDIVGSLAVGTEIDQSSQTSPDLPACTTQGTPEPSPSPSG